MNAAEVGHAKTVELLLDKGADVKAKTNEGKTALMIAKEKRNTEIVKLLKQHGAKEKWKTKKVN